MHKHREYELENILHCRAGKETVFLSCEYFWDIKSVYSPKSGQKIKIRKLVSQKSAKKISSSKRKSFDNLKNISFWDYFNLTLMYLDFKSRMNENYKWEIHNFFISNMLKWSILTVYKPPHFFSSQEIHWNLFSKKFSKNLFSKNSKN